MGQLRSACRALLLEHPSPRAALAGLDRFAARLPGARCTTAVCAVLDPETGELVYSSAGHPPPILVHADGATQTLEDGRTIPLGLRPNRPRPEARVIIPPRAMLLLYTDGLVERRRRALDDGIAQVRDLLQEGRESPWRTWRTRSCPRLAPPGGYQDDVALLLYRHPAPLQLDFPAERGPARRQPCRVAQLVDPCSSDTAADSRRTHRRRGGCRQRHRTRPPRQAGRRDPAARDRAAQTRCG